MYKVNIKSSLHSDFKKDAIDNRKYVMINE
jgi:hypothetical protein